jgi:hypothetical protein
MKRFGHPRLFAVTLLLWAFVPAVAGAATAPKDLATVADEVAKEVEALRGWTFKQPVEKRFCTPQEAMAYVKKQVQEQVPPERIRKIQAFLRTVGLLPQECDLKKTLLGLLEEQVGGYYDTDAKALYLVGRDEKLPELVVRIMLAHEFTHALDDQHIGLDRFLKSLTGKTEDLDLVAASVVEGSATSLMTQYMTRAQMSGRFNLADLQGYALREVERSKVFVGAPRYFSTILGVYLCGMQFLSKGNLMAAALGDNRAVGRNLQAAFKDPPQSTEQILHPEKYWNAAARDAPVLVDDAAAVKMLQRPGRWIVHTNTVGEMLCAVLTTPQDRQPNLLTMQMAAAWTNAAATGWGGDRFYLLASGPGAEAAATTLTTLQGVWITLWDTQKDRDEFVAAYEQKPATGRRTIATLGNLGAVALFGFDEAEEKALADRLTKTPPPMTRAGKPWGPWVM